MLVNLIVPPQTAAMNGQIKEIDDSAKYKMFTDLPRATLSAQLTARSSYLAARSSLLAAHSFPPTPHSPLHRSNPAFAR
jgi:hypothetical protein